MTLAAQNVLEVELSSAPGTFIHVVVSPNDEISYSRSRARHGSRRTCCSGRCSDPRQTDGSEECGVSFELPKGWTAETVEPETDVQQCAVALRPGRWSGSIAKSRWNSPDPPLRLIVFKSTASFQDALDDRNFETQDDGKVTMEQRGRSAQAQPYSAGKAKGIAAYTYFRGFARDGAVFPDENSRFYSGEAGHYVLRNGRLIVAFECEGGDPDYPVDCGPTVQAVAKSIRRR